MFEKYQLHNSIESVECKFNKNQTTKKCRFCNLSYPEVTFLNKPHIIPELFGANNFVSNFECDSCNKKFQKYETDTSNFIQHYLSILLIKTKNGIPIFQSSKKPYYNSNTIKPIENKPVFNFGQNINDFEIDYENKTISIYIKTKKFRPFYIYKTLLKIGISLLTDEELKENKHFLKYLNSDEIFNDGTQFLTCFRYVYKTKYSITPRANLFKANSTKIDGNQYPEYILILYFANIAIQFFLPLSNMNLSEYNQSNNLEIELFKPFIFELKSVKNIDIQSLELSTDNQIIFNDKIFLSFDSVNIY